MIKFVQHSNEKVYSFLQQLSLFLFLIFIKKITPIANKRTPTPRINELLKWITVADSPRPVKSVNRAGKVQHGESIVNNAPTAPKPTPLPINALPFS